MDFHPVRYVKQHPVATLVTLGIGYLLPRYVALPIPGFRVKGGASVSSDD
jgi:hypothetical protein